MLPGKAATRIQASFRGHLVRRELVENVRSDFEEVMRRLEAPLRDANIPSTSPFPKRELGWKSSTSLSPPSVLDLLDNLDDDDDDEDDTSPIVATPPYTGGAAAAVAAAIDAVSVAAENRRAFTGGGEARMKHKNTAGVEGAPTEQSQAQEQTQEQEKQQGQCGAVVGGAAGAEASTAEHLSMLQQEMAWAQAALDDRRQHLRRMRLHQHELQLQRGGVGIQ